MPRDADGGDLPEAAVPAGNGQELDASDPGFTLAEAPADDAAKEGRVPQRDRIVACAIKAGIRFWRDPDGNAFASVPREGRIERYRVRSRPFRLLLRALYGAAHPNARASEAAGGTVPGGISDTAMAEALPTLEAMALAGEVREPDVRVCQDAAGTVWVDLGDPTWRAVAVTASGWRVVDTADVPLVRPDGMRALPLPACDPDALAKLRRLYNLAGEDDVRLLVACMLAALWPSGPYPVLAFDGEQGSGKSTACKMFRRLVDPNAAELRAMPRGTDDLLIAARNGRVVAADNVSHVTPEMADDLCRMATGGGFGKRALYTDGEEVIVHACRPVLLNGIPSLLARGDLADRAIALTLPAIADADRRTEADVWRDFDAAAPGILALLLDAAAMALRELPRFKLPAPPRMADFAKLACVAAPAFEWTAAEMVAALRLNRTAATEAVVAADPVADAVMALASRAGAGAWRGTATELLAELGNRVPEAARRDRAWPKAANALTARLRRVTPGLRRMGVSVTLATEGHAKSRTITIQTPEYAESSSASSANGISGSYVNGLHADDRRFQDRPHIVRTSSASGAPDADDADGLRTIQNVGTVRMESPMPSGVSSFAGDADDDLAHVGGRDITLPPSAPWEGTL